MKTRKILVCVFLSIFLLFWLSMSQAAELKFGYTPVFSEAEMKAEFEPVNNYLSKALGVKISLYIAKDYGDLQKQMEAGVVDIGSFSPFAYVDAARGGKIKLIAQSILDNSAFYHGIIIARKTTGASNLTDLEGKRFAFVDKKSASGYVYPRAMLIEKGVNPDKFFKEILFAGNHSKVIDQVLSGEADAGATYDGAIPYAKGQGKNVDELQIIAKTEPIPHDAITVREGFDPNLVNALQEALVKLAGTTEGKAIIAKSRKKLSGYILAEDSKFDIVRRTAKIAGLWRTPQ